MKKIKCKELEVKEEKVKKGCYIYYKYSYRCKLKIEPFRSSIKKTCEKCPLQIEIIF